MHRVSHLLRRQFASVVVLFLAGFLPTFAQCEEMPAELKAKLKSLQPVAWEKAQQIWEWAEPGYQEVKSSTLLSDWLEEAGFRVQRGVAGIPTAFIAEIGKGQPVVAILAEFDALPGLSQDAVPYRQPREGNGYGQGCGHHVFGVASTMAALAVGEQIEAGKLPGTIRLYGCPAEEGGSAKAFMVRDGLFDDVDAVLHWHPSSVNTVGDRSSLARIAVRFRFHGISSHAAGSPDQGRSALDAVELTNFGTQLLREHIPDSARIHYVISAGGDAPNIVPNFAEVYYYVRHPNSEVLRPLYERVVKCAEAGALATETKLEVAHEGGIVEILPNSVLSEVTRRHLLELNDLKYTPEELKFALKLQETFSNPRPIDSIQNVSDRGGELSKGSTDVGDVSWVVPTTGFNVACWVPGTPGHSWQAVACGKTTIARKGMNLAAEVLAASARDMLTSPELLTAARNELNRRLGTRKYVPLIGENQKPPLDYRRRNRAGQSK